MHSELIQALIHSQSDLCNLQLHTCGTGLDDTRHRILRNRPACICILSAVTRALPWANWNCQLPRRACASLSISLESESRKKPWSPLFWKQQWMSRPLSRGPAQHQSHSLKVQKDLFKSSELCCSTRCYLVLSALSQWIGLRFGKHISCCCFLLCGGFKGFFFLCVCVCVVAHVELRGKKVWHTVGVKWIYNDYLSLLGKKHVL